MTRRSGAQRGPSGGLLCLAGVLLLSAARVRLPGRALAAEAGRNGVPILVASEGPTPDVCASGPGDANATVDGAFAASFPRLQPILAP
jgi:hypothetical protein